MHTDRDIAKKLYEELMNEYSVGIKLDQITTSLPEFLRSFFSALDPAIEDHEQMKRILKYSLIFFHPDKLIGKSSSVISQAKSIFHEMCDTKDHLESIFPSKDASEHDKDEVINPSFVVNTVFQNHGVEKRLYDLGLKYPELGVWLEQKSYNASVMFLNKLFPPDYGGMSMEFLLVRLALVDEFAKLLLPADKQLADFIRDLDLNHVLENDPIPNKSIPTALYWLCHQLVLNYAEPNIAPIDDLTSVFPTYLDLIENLEVYKYFPNKIQIERLIDGWSDNHLPHIKAMFQQMLSDFDIYKRNGSIDTSVENLPIFNIDTHTIIVNKSDINFSAILEYEQIANYVNNPDILGSLEKLEEMRSSILVEFDLLPDAIVQYDFCVQGEKPCEETVGVLFIKTLSELNESINKLRNKLDFIEENPMHQPRFIIQTDRLNFIAPGTGLELPYFYTVTGISYGNDIHIHDKSTYDSMFYVPGLMDLYQSFSLHDIYLRLPAIIHPEIVNLMSNCREEIRISQDKFQYECQFIKRLPLKDRLNAIIQKLPNELINDPNTKEIMNEYCNILEAQYGPQLILRESIGLNLAPSTSDSLKPG
ncbi:MAG: hypothetical protein P1U74_02545 [Legionellaceae bacterium]|nr:hypothetical protein [Legionellaceae bacterium]